jgi:hypothetical protein
MGQCELMPALLIGDPLLTLRFVGTPAQSMRVLAVLTTSFYYPHPKMVPHDCGAWHCRRL